MARILEEGCGVGMYVRALQPYADEVYGIDVEPDYLVQAVDTCAGRAGCNWPWANGCPIPMTSST